MPNGWRVSGERRAERDERVRCTRMLDAMKKDTAVAFSRIAVKERRERYVTDGVPKGFYRGEGSVGGGVRVGVGEVAVGLCHRDGRETVAKANRHFSHPNSNAT